MHKKLIFLSLFFSVFLYSNLRAQSPNEIFIRNLPKQTKAFLQKAFEVPALKNSFLVDNGDGKICSCQFFIQIDSIDRVFEQGKLLRIKNITIKGLFDGSQMHVARIYFEDSSGYFKFKCYSPEITIQQLQEYISIGENSIANKE